MLSAKEALDIILSSVSTLEREQVDIIDAHGRVLGEDITAEENVPPFDNSAMDGFAVRAQDVSNTPILLRIVGEVSAGQLSSRELRPGEAIRAMTGRQIPPGADAVVQIEWAEAAGENQVRVQRAVSVGQNIRQEGEDIQKGQVIFQGGRELRAAELGVLASLGRKSVHVYQVPRVAFLATGNELLDVDQPLEPGKIRNSNSFTVCALIKENSAQPVDLGIARDKMDELKKKILQGLESDALVTTGGVSVGNYDLVQTVMKDVGIEIRLWKVNIKPGMPFLFGMHKSTPVFGLPGNPVSTMVTFLKFVKPALRKMMGMSSLETEFKFRAEITQDFKKTDGKRHFIRGVLETQNGVLRVRSTGSQSSGVLTSLSKANCLIVVPEHVETLRKGDSVEVELL